MQGQAEHGCSNKCQGKSYEFNFIEKEAPMPHMLHETNYHKIMQMQGSFQMSSVQNPLSSLYARLLIGFPVMDSDNLQYIIGIHWIVKHSKTE